jgi:uncharacterized protein YcfJ
MSFTASRLGRALLLVLVVLIPLSVGGCFTLAGAGAGAYAGNQFGHGKGKTAATAGGAAVGAVIGNQFDRAY